MFVVSIDVCDRCIDVCCTYRCCCVSIDVCCNLVYLSKIKKLFILVEVIIQTVESDIICLMFYRGRKIELYNKYKKRQDIKFLLHLVYIY